MRVGSLHITRCDKCPACDWQTFDDPIDEMYGARQDGQFICAFDGGIVFKGSIPNWCPLRIFRETPEKVEPK